MNSENNENFESSNQIIYEDDWKNVSKPEYAPINDYDNENDEEQTSFQQEKITKKKSNSPKQLLITLQLIACILIVLFAFAVKSTGGEFYKTLHNMYYTALNNSVIFDNNNSNFDLGKLFGPSTKDEA